jgi:hypothetical protein
MNYLSFSTGYWLARLVKLLPVSRLGFVRGTTSIVESCFPQRFPHRLYEPEFFLFSEIAGPTHFCTGSTTSTKNMNKNFCVVVDS